MSRIFLTKRRGSRFPRRGAARSGCDSSSGRFNYFIARRGIHPRRAHTGTGVARTPTRRTPILTVASRSRQLQKCSLLMHVAVRTYTSPLSLLEASFFPREDSSSVTVLLPRMQLLLAMILVLFSILSLYYALLYALIL